MKIRWNFVFFLAFFLVASLSSTSFVSAKSHHKKKHHKSSSSSSTALVTPVPVPADATVSPNPASIDPIPTPPEQPIESTTPTDPNAIVNSTSDPSSSPHFPSAVDNAPVVPENSSLNPQTATPSTPAQNVPDSAVTPAPAPQPAPTPDPLQSPAPTVTAPVNQDSKNPLAGAHFFSEDPSPASRQATLWSSRPADAALMLDIAQTPQAKWLTDPDVSNTTTAVKDYLNAAAQTNSFPMFVFYTIPNRDCGGYSAGGTHTDNEYLNWVESVQKVIGETKAVVILEPDALPFTGCMNDSETNARLSLLNQAVALLAKSSGIATYIDAGHADALPAGEIANRLIKAGVDQAAGFALNVSNFMSTSSNESYGADISQGVGGKHFIIDTSRNGSSSYTSASGWCNPSDAALGQKPTTNTHHPLVDAYLWVKHPGESDGACNGGPSAGVWWPEYALRLAQASSYLAQK